MENRKRELPHSRGLFSNFIALTAFAFIAIGIAILIGEWMNRHYGILFRPQGTAYWAQAISGIIAPFFSIAGVLLIFLNLRTQNDTFERTRIENQFFEMMKIYRDNVEEMNYVPWDSDLPKNPVIGRRVFVKIVLEVQNVYKELVGTPVIGTV